MNKEILRLALPSILANITIPIVGIVDVAIAGHIADATAIGGIAIGTMLFDLLYWNFGFLRIGTGGMTAQAFGRNDMEAAAAILRRSITIALRAALCIWLLQGLFLSIALSLIPCSREVAIFARSYFYIRIWAAPATLSLMAFKGWFIGMQNTVAPMVCDLVVNGINILASYLLAVHTPLRALGVAWGTLIAQYGGMMAAIGLLYRGIVSKRFPIHIRWKTAANAGTIPSLSTLNTQLFVRSLCFMVVYVGFTSLTSLYGDTQLAIGSIMMKLFMLFSYFIDGFAYAGEALTGRFIGAHDTTSLHKSIKRLFAWTFAIGTTFTVLYAAVGKEMFELMTSDAIVTQSAEPFLPWLVAMPLVSCIAFMWDGIYVGATAGSSVRNCMIAAAIGFVLSYYFLADIIGVQAVYVAYFAHLIIRASYLTIARPKSLRLLIFTVNH